MTYRLSVLDQSPIPAGGTAADGIRQTLALARAADRLGYHRYWLAEHHASPALAGAAPEVLLGPVALATSRIRIGSGGIMLPHYSPFKVAETFRLLAAMAPDRLDLGIGRAPGSDQRTALALRQDRSRGFGAEDFPSALGELLAYLDQRPDGGLPPDHPFAVLRDTLPGGGGDAPTVWLLGSSPDSARLAAALGLPYCIADFINAEAAPLARIYRQAFRPSHHLAAPQVIAAVWTIAAETEAAARRHAAPAAMMFAHLARGRLIPVPSEQEAEAWLAEQGALPEHHRRRTILGTPADVRAGLDQVAALYEADELMLVNIMADPEARLASYALVAAEYGLAELDRAA
ncbi:LLM class flavin-dependent oxidoreductase [Sphingomonas morindae]|uniref:LLM class flavin-dependent oxidoreductase n=1 Tax=Sphingomonas morindae TaxID=1541170 RepID=A0ABY4XBQ4_9SPHN|nr:LLM class flavin-dependent oxidoreductase [Sphingomonas morindae]USI74386.1 LLM class flavin-dependent oxidoreductase [Sphingomonas morindae]